MGEEMIFLINTFWKPEYYVLQGDGDMREIECTSYEFQYILNLPILILTGKPEYMIINSMRGNGEHELV